MIEHIQKKSKAMMSLPFPFSLPLPLSEMEAIPNVPSTADCEVKEAFQVEWRWLEALKYFIYIRQ